jgi:hypothetical protein
MSNVTSFVAATGLTVLDSRAEMRADAKSAADTGVVTCELILLSRHHFTITPSVMYGLPDFSQEVAHS